MTAVKEELEKINNALNEYADLVSSGVSSEFCGCILQIITEKQQEVTERL